MQLELVLKETVCSQRRLFSLSLTINQLSVKSRIFPLKAVNLTHGRSRFSRQVAALT